MPRHLEHALHLLPDEVAHQGRLDGHDEGLLGIVDGHGAVEGLVPVHGVGCRRRVGIGVHRLDRHSAGLGEHDLAGIGYRLEVSGAAADLEGSHAPRTDEGRLGGLGEGGRGSRQGQGDNGES